MQQWFTMDSLLMRSLQQHNCDGAPLFGFWVFRYGEELHEEENDAFIIHDECNDELSVCFLHTEDWSSAAALRKSSSVDSFDGFCHTEEDEPESDDDVSSKRITMVHE